MIITFLAVFTGDDFASSQDLLEFSIELLEQMRNRNMTAAQFVESLRSEQREASILGGGSESGRQSGSTAAGFSVQSAARLGLDHSSISAPPSSSIASASRSGAEVAVASEASAVAMRSAGGIDSGYASSSPSGSSSPNRSSPNQSPSPRLEQHLNPTTPPDHAPSASSSTEASLSDTESFLFMSLGHSSSSTFDAMSVATTLASSHVHTTQQQTAASSIWQMSQPVHLERGMLMLFDNNF